MGERLLSEDELRARGIKGTNATWLRLEKLDLFPRRVYPTPNCKAWLEKDVEDHVAKISRERNNALSALGEKARPAVAARQAKRHEQVAA